MKSPLEKKTFFRRASLIFLGLSLGLYSFFRDIEKGKIRSRQTAKQVLNHLIGKATIGIEGWAEESVPQMYKLGMLYANNFIKGAGIRISGVHKQEVARLIDVEKMRLMSSMDGVRKNAYFSLDEAFRMKAKERVLSGINKAQTIRETQKDLAKLLKNKQYDGLRDRGGRKWDLDNYSEMAVRTIHTEVNNSAISNVALENGFDLVRLTHSPKPCSLCLPYDGAVISLTGTNKDYPSYEEIKEAGVFHPNCMHSFTPITEEEAETVDDG